MMIFNFHIMLCLAVAVSTCSVMFSDATGEKGIVVESVTPDSPAAKAGVKFGDRLLSYDGKPLPSPYALQAAEQNTVGKKEVALGLQRGNEMLTLTVPLGTLGIQTRPELPPVALQLYSEGRKAQQAKKMDKAISNWSTAAKAAHQAGDKAAAAWLYGRVGETYEGQGKWKEAQEAHAAAWELLGSIAPRGRLDAAAQSRILFALGQCSQNLNDFPTAKRWYERAQEVDAGAGNEMWVATDLNRLGYLPFLREDYQTASDYFIRSLEIRKRLVPDSLDVAGSLKNLGLATYYLGKLPAALDYFTSALKIRERLENDTRELADLFQNMGVINKFLGHPTPAHDYLTRALAIYQKMNQPLMVAQVLSHLGDVAMARGDLIAYQDYFTRALKIYEQHKPDSWEVANLRNNLGLTAYSFGDLEAAQHYYTGALKIFEQLNPDSMEVAMCLNNLGALLVDRGESEKGRKYLTHASEIYKQQSPTSWQFASNLSNLGYMALRSNDLTRAQDDFNRALAIHEQLSPNSLDVASRLSDLGMVAAKRRDLAAAKDYYNRALEIFQRLDHGSLNFALLLDNMGDVAFDERRFSDALDHFTRAVKIVETYRRKILSPDIRAFFVAQNTELYRRLLRTHLALNDVPAAFATLERARARSLVDMLAERRMDFSADAPKELLQRQRELDAKRTFAYNQLGQLDPDKDSKEIEALRADINDIAIKQRQLVTEIRSAHPKYATLQYPEPLDLKGVQQALNEGTLLLAYSVDEDETYLFAVTKTNLQLYPLKVSDKELHERVKTFRSALAEQKDFVEDACQLYDWLIRPAQAQVDKAQRVLICPDGPLYTLPFAALVKGEIEKLGNEGNGRGRRYFVEMKPLHTIVSMTVYAELRKQSSSFNTPTLQHSNTPTLLALGDPAYDATPETVKQDFRKRGGKKLTRLPNTRKEVEAITNLYGKQASKYLSKEANETVAKQESGKAKILHFACHGVLDNFDPLASALALTPDGKKEDGMLRAYEVIQNMRLNADLVVLSACETGLGKETKNEGIVGLTRAFQYAGAKSVVVSLWNVADVSTTPLMTEFYRQLKSSQSKDEALQAAQLALLRGRDYKHPSHWAAFVLVGDWK